MPFILPPVDETETHLCQTRILFPAPRSGPTVRWSIVRGEVRPWRPAPGARRWPHGWSCPLPPVGSACGWRNGSTRGKLRASFTGLKWKFTERSDLIPSRSHGGVAGQSPDEPPPPHVPCCRWRDSHPRSTSDSGLKRFAQFTTICQKSFGGPEGRSKVS